jgi:SulP family sulfate permease
MKLVPMSTLAAILIIVSYNMGEWEFFKKLPKLSKGDAAVFLITFSLTIVIDLVAAIGTGMALHLILSMINKNTARDDEFIEETA